MIDYYSNDAHDLESLAAFLVVGNSMDKVIPPGSYVIAKWLAFARQHVDGDIVVVRRSTGDLAETTLKRLRYSTDGADLYPESHDPKHQSKIELKKNDSTYHVEIIAIVIASHRQFV